MTVRVVPVAGRHVCCMCPIVRRSPWSVLASEGWLSHPVGSGREPIVLCGSCASLIAARRAAGLQEQLDRVA